MSSEEIPKNAVPPVLVKVYFSTLHPVRYAQLAEVTYTASTKSDSFLQAVASTACSKEQSFAAAVKPTDRSSAR